VDHAIEYWHSNEKHRKKKIKQKKFKLATYCTTFVELPAETIFNIMFAESELYRNDQFLNFDHNKPKSRNQCPNP
jgi:hypothetical protein